jgi:hypothetical protein
MSQKSQAISPETSGMCPLLEQAGFRVRGRRAECIHCEGGSHWTVSFTSEVAFCHRCHWTANAITLTRELGLLAGDPKMHEFLRGARERRRQRAETEKFRRFATERIERISRHYRDLARAATHAEQCLRQGESDPVIHELAWSALERFRSFEARIEREGLTDLDVLRTEWGKSRAAA